MPTCTLYLWTAVNNTCETVRVLTQCGS